MMRQLYAVEQYTKMKSFKAPLAICMNLANNDIDQKEPHKMLFVLLCTKFRDGQTLKCWKLVQSMATLRRE